MPTDSSIVEQRRIQHATKDVLTELASKISALDTERSIADKAYQQLCLRGLVDTWYYQSPALVLLGSRSCWSQSGKDYEPSLEVVGQFNLVTVDLSPSLRNLWGDCARSFYIEQGQVKPHPSSPELLAGKVFLENLHAEVLHFARPETTYHELFEWTNQQIAAVGFENLDFLGNVGHTISARREEREFITAYNCHRLSDTSFFTFEPHVRVVGGRWGFKHENIFFFNSEGRIEEL